MKWTLMAAMALCYLSVQLSAVLPDRTNSEAVKTYLRQSFEERTDCDASCGSQIGGWVLTHGNKLTFRIFEYIVNHDAVGLRQLLELHASAHTYLEDMTEENARELITLGVNGCAKWRGTPLAYVVNIIVGSHAAPSVKESCLEMTNILLQHGACPEGRVKLDEKNGKYSCVDGSSALHQAVSIADVALFAELIKHAQCVDALDKNGKTARDAAKATAHGVFRIAPLIDARKEELAQQAAALAAVTEKAASLDVPA